MRHQTNALVSRPAPLLRVRARASVFVGAALSALALVAAGSSCDNAAAEQANARQAQNEANAKISAAESEAEAKSKAAQAVADSKIADARAGFMKLREDYRHATTTDLEKLDAKIVTLEARAKVVLGTAKGELDKALVVIRADRARFATSFAALETASATTWDDAKASLDKQAADLKKLVDGA
jgi:hypothetical protein